jgi:hypothetical protein
VEVTGETFLTRETDCEIAADNHLFLEVEYLAQVGTAKREVAVLTANGGQVNFALMDGR